MRCYTIPANHEVQALGDAPPPAFVERLRELGVAPLWVGQVIVATWEPNQGKVLSAIYDLGLNLQITFNKGAVMVLPVGVTKASGLRGALAQLGLSPLNCIGVGDAENDLAFLDVCGLPVAVANALPSVKERAAFVTTGTRGAGVASSLTNFLRRSLPSSTPPASEDEWHSRRSRASRCSTCQWRVDLEIIEVARRGGRCAVLRNANDMTAVMQPLLRRPPPQ